MGEVINIKTGKSKVKTVFVEYHCETCRTTKDVEMTEDQAELLRGKPIACPVCMCVYYCHIIPKQ